jgi:t-SNARE complex subunit (syntaxin)
LGRGGAGWLAGWLVVRWVGRLHGSPGMPGAPPCRICFHIPCLRDVRVHALFLRLTSTCCTMASSRMQELGLTGSAEGTKQGVKPVGVMAAFKKEQDKINDACQQIAEATRNIQNLIERFSKATKSSEEDEISAELEGIVKKTQAVAMQTKALIKRLNEENKDSSKFGHNEKVIREQGIKASAEKFIKRVKEYQIAQQMFNTRMKDTMTRRVRIIAPDKSEEDVKRIIDEGKSSEIFKQVILEGKGQLASTYRDVMDTHQVSESPLPLHPFNTYIHVPLPCAHECK